MFGFFSQIGRIIDLVKQIQLKFIQRDSLAYLQFFVAETFGHFETAADYYSSMGLAFTRDFIVYKKNFSSNFQLKCMKWTKKRWKIWIKNRKLNFYRFENVLWPPLKTRNLHKFRNSTILRRWGGNLKY